jgi:hypothetical protein
VNLLDLRARPEGKPLEFKRELSSGEGAVKSSVAFANTAGGVLLLAAIDVSEQALQRFGGARQRLADGRPQ